VQMISKKSESDFQAHIAAQQEQLGRPPPTHMPLVPLPNDVRQGSSGPWPVRRLVVDVGPEDAVITKVTQNAAQLYNVTGRVPLELGSARAPGDVVIQLVIAANSKDALQEHYHLRTDAAGVHIEASTEQGLFYGLQTLRQLLQKEAASVESGQWQLPEVEIDDAPAVEWRGMMLDVSRHFFPVEDVKQFLTTMALFKLNRFHWHLTDDQGWRLPIAAWPELVRTGAWRDGSPTNQQDAYALVHDGVKHGGAYTLADVREVVQHAASLYIEVVPEVDIPGHAQAAVASYPELGNTDMPGWSSPDVSHFFGPQNYTLNPTPKGFQFVRDVVDTQAELFPSPYIHLGGDEVSTYQWTTSTRAHDFLMTLGATDANEIAAYFQNVGIESCQAHGRRPVVWEEASTNNPDLSKDAIVVLWKVPQLGQEKGYHERVGDLTAKGYDVILAPAMYTYLDFSEWGVGSEYPNPMISGSVSFATTYDLPVPKARAGGKGKVLGGQAQLWTEYIASKEQLDYHAWPRGASIAERLWDGGARPRDTVANLQKRMKPRLAELGFMGVHYRPFDGSRRETEL